MMNIVNIVIASTIFTRLYSLYPLYSLSIYYIFREVPSWSKLSENGNKLEQHGNHIFVISHWFLHNIINNPVFKHWVVFFYTEKNNKQVLKSKSNLEHSLALTAKIAKDGPKMAQHSPKVAQHRPKMAQHSSRWPNIAPRWLNIAPT